MRQERQLKKDMFKSFYREQYVFWRWAAWGITEWWDMTGARNSPPGMEMWGECRTKKYQRILCDIWTYLGVLKKLGNMMIGIEVTNPHAVWKKLVSKSWWKGTFMGNPSYSIDSIVGKRQACDVVGLPKVSQASVLVWWGGSSGSCWWLNY